MRWGAWGSQRRWGYSGHSSMVCYLPRVPSCSGHTASSIVSHHLPVTDVLQSHQAFLFRIHVLRCPPLGRWLGKRIAVPSGHFGWMLAIPERTWLKPLTLLRAGFRKTDLLIQSWYEAPLYSKLSRDFAPQVNYLQTNLFILSSFFFRWRFDDTLTGWHKGIWYTLATYTPWFQSQHNSSNINGSILQ